MPSYYLFLTARNDLVIVNENQCDQMSKICFQYLTVYNRENLPNINKTVPKLN